MAREALGRGLRALLEGTEAVGEAELLQLPVSQVHPNPYQPRQHFDTERLQELASSLKAQGLLQPIVVRRQLARLRADRRGAPLASSANGRFGDHPSPGQARQ